ncbi:MAG: hypothetical protein HUU26_11430, partial [Gemmatimonadaceae bacterium]|nr:hypothetical protein [Gemmatimonadaceae bacterium]
PAHFQGVPFLGAAAAPPRSHVFGGKDRQGECADTIRYVRDARFQYNRNFHPEVPFGQYMSYNWQHASMRAWEKLHREGRLSGPPARFFAANKPVEELYDNVRDPWHVNNLAGDPAHAAELSRLRATLFAEMERAGDLGLLPERELHIRSAGSTPYAIATDPKLNPLPELHRAAELANRPDPRRIPDLATLLQSADSAVQSVRTEALAMAARVTGEPSRDVNYVMPRFVLHHLPLGMAGLFIAAVMAAAMSSIAAELNSLSTATVIDFYRRWVRPEASDAHYLSVSKIATGFWGLFACFVAVQAGSLGSLIEVVNRFGSFFYGSILGVFLLAMIPKARAAGAFWGLIAGMTAVGLVSRLAPGVAFLWHNVVGALTVVLAGMAVSVVKRES